MKLFVVVSRVPYPLEKGDKLRAYHQIKELAKRHEVHLCCLSDEKPDDSAKAHLESIVSSVKIYQLSKFLMYLNLVKALFSNLPFQVCYFYQKKVHRKMAAHLHGIDPDHIYCQLVRTSEYIKNEHNYSKTLDYMDAFSKGMERRIERSGAFKKYFVRSEYYRLKAYENIIFEYFNGKTIITEADRQLIYHPQQQQIAIVPNGVDTQFFEPKESEKPYDLVFVGNMSYAPNVDAAQYLAKELLPILHKTHPNAKVLISGASPAPAVKALANQHVTVTGWVEDIRDAYASGKICIAPMRIGTGLQNKLLEAMSMEIPCLTTELANSALGAETEQHLLVGNTSEKLMEQAIRLLNDASFSQKLAKNGRTFVETRYNWEATVLQLEQVFQPH